MNRHDKQQKTPVFAGVNWFDVLIIKGVRCKPPGMTACSDWGKREDDTHMGGGSSPVKGWRVGIREGCLGLVFTVVIIKGLSEFVNRPKRLFFTIVLMD